MNNKPEWCPQDIWDRVLTSFPDDWDIEDGIAYHEPGDAGVTSLKLEPIIRAILNPEPADVDA